MFNKLKTRDKTLTRTFQCRLSIDIGKACEIDDGEQQVANLICHLLLIPLLVIVVIAVHRQRQAAVLYSSVQVLKTLPKTFALLIKRFLPWLRFLGMALVIIALARPQHGQEEFRVRTEGIAIQMAIDRSGSMMAMDFELDGERVNRLEVVKQVFKDFVIGKGNLPGRPDDLIGLIAFGGYADGICPLTLDHGALLQILDTVKIAEEIRDRRGRLLNEGLLQEERATAIGDAVALGVERLRNVEAKSKVLILLSDGENTAGAIEPEEAAKAAKAFDIEGPAFINCLSPCPLGWGYDGAMTVDIAMLAADTCMWPLYEVEHGEGKLTYKPKEKKPIEEYLEQQRRFRHLFKDDKGAEMRKQMQEWVDYKWEQLLKKAGEA